MNTCPLVSRVARFAIRIARTEFAEQLRQPTPRTNLLRIRISTGTNDTRAHFEQLVIRLTLANHQLLIAVMMHDIVGNSGRPSARAPQSLMPPTAIGRASSSRTSRHTAHTQMMTMHESSAGFLTTSTSTCHPSSLDVSVPHSEPSSHRGSLNHDLTSTSASGPSFSATANSSLELGQHGTARRIRRGGHFQQQPLLPQ